MQDASSESHAALERLRGARRPSPTDDADPAGTPPRDEADPAREPAEEPAPADDAPDDVGASPAPDAGPTPEPAEDAPAARAPRVARPRRALAAPGEISRRELRRHERALRTGRPETAAERRVREGRRTDVHRAMESLRTPGAPAEQRPRRDLSEILDRLGSPDLARFTAPLVGTVERILPAPGQDPEKAAEAARRREEAEARRRARLQAGRERAAESARRRAEEQERLARQAAEREAALRDDDARREARDAEEAAAAAKEARRQERLRERRAAGRAAAEERARLAAEAAERAREQELREAEEAAAAAAREDAALQDRLRRETERRREAAERQERRVRERAEEQARLEQAARIARRRREEERERHRREAERRRRLAQEEKARAAAEEERRRREREERRRREAEAAAERARVQAERRAREEAELAERERLRREAEAEAERRRLAEEAERRRLEAERAEAERRRQAEEAERRRREAEEAARRAAEAKRAHAKRTRARTVLHAERALAQARLLEDRARDTERRAAEEEARRLREHQDRESRALYRAARELEGPEVIPAASRRPLLSRPEERLTDDELFARARAALPEWRHRQRLATKAQAVGAETAAGQAARPATGPVPLIPGYTPAAPEEPAGPATARDRRGQFLLTLAWAAFVLAGAWGLGLFRLVPGLDALDAGAYPAAGDGRHGPDATVFSLFPVHPVIWPVLWLLTGLHVARQWGRGQGAAPRHRRTRGAVAGALLALALWFPLAILVPWGLESVAWLTALALMLGAVRRLGARPSARRAARVAEDGALGVLLGTLLAAAPTALAATLHAWGVHLGWFPTELAATLVMLVLLLGAVRLVLGGRGRMGVALGMAWTLLCLALPRLLPSPLGAEQSAWVGLLAAFGALLLLTAVGVRRSWARQVEHDAARAAVPAAG